MFILACRAYFQLIQMDLCLSRGDSPSCTSEYGVSGCAIGQT